MTLRFGTLVISSAKQIILSRSAKARNIFRMAGGAVTLGTTCHFEGNILAAEHIAMETGASINGRMLAETQVALQMAAVTMHLLNEANTNKL